MKWVVTILCVLLYAAAFCQESSDEDDGYKGDFSLGLRTTTSLFTNDQKPGLGSGGQFRLGLAKRINTEWYADYIQSNLSNLGRRQDGHIGWSVMFYPFVIKKKFTPYIAAGQCFDYTKISSFSTDVSPKERWSAATQAGMGLNIRLTDNTGITLLSQYMLHLGNDVHYHIEDVGNHKKLEIDNVSHHSSLEGHLLLTMSLNIIIADLW